MKRIFITALVLSVLVFAGSQNSSGQTGGDNSKLEAEIGKVLRDYYDAFSRHDVAATSALYADDGFVYEGGYSTIKQVKTGIRAYLQSPAAGSKDLYEMEDLKILSVAADTAMANYTVITKSEQNGKTTIRRDRSTNVFAQRGGRWLIVADHTSPLPNPVAPTMSGMPVGWIRTPSYSSNGYSMSVDTNIKHGGKSSAAIELTCGENEFDSLGQIIAAGDFRGKRVRLTGWLKTENADSAVLWMRVDGNRRTLGFVGSLGSSSDRLPKSRLNRL